VLRSQELAGTSVRPTKIVAVFGFIMGQLIVTDFTTSPALALRAVFPDFSRGVNTRGSNIGWFDILPIGQGYTSTSPSGGYAASRVSIRCRLRTISSQMIAIAAKATTTVQTIR
jgi:hypothetical protein